MSKRNTIRTKESQLKKVVEASVKQILDESCSTLNYNGHTEKFDESSEPNSETLLEMARINILQTETMRVPNGFRYTGSLNPL